VTDESLVEREEKKKINISKISLSSFLSWTLLVNASPPPSSLHMTLSAKMNDETLVGGAGERGGKKKSVRGPRRSARERREEEQGGRRKEASTSR
jgi:hypothetical protein